MSYWAEIKNDYFEGRNEIDQAVEGDVMAQIAIDAWKTEDDWEEGVVIACVMLTTHGDIIVDYRDNIARSDEMAQTAIQSAKEELRSYYSEQTAALQVSNAKEMLEQNMAFALIVAGLVETMHRKEDVLKRLKERIDTGTESFTLADFSDSDIARIAELTETNISIKEGYFTPYWNCVEEAIDEFLEEKRSSSAPVARLDYLAPSGKVIESIDYHSEEAFLSAMKEDLDSGVPLIVVLYRDSNGNTLSRSFLKELNTPPKAIKEEDAPGVA